MGAITGTKQSLSTLSGDYKLLALTATVASASDTITISLASHGISEMISLVGYAVTGGLDAAFTSVQVALTSSTQITITSLEQDGTAATNFTGTTMAISVLGK